MPSADERHSRLPQPLPLQRPYLRATPDERRSDDASRKPSSSSGSGADSYTIPLLLSMAIIVLERPRRTSLSVQLTALRLLHYRPPRAATHAGAHASRCPRAHAAPGARRPLATEPPRAAARPLPPARHARGRGGRARRPGPPLDVRALRRRRLGHRRGERPPRRLDHARPRPALALRRGHAALDRPARPARGAARHRARARAARGSAGALLSAAGGGQCPPARRVAPRAARPRGHAERRLPRR